MLSLLFTLQYKCTAKFGVSGAKVEKGGDCPDEVACSKMSIKDLEKRYGEAYIKLYSGTYAECAVGYDQEDCDALCKVACTQKKGTYTEIVAGMEAGTSSYNYYCPKGKQKYSGGLSAGAIAGIVIACIVVVAAIVFCVWFFVFHKKGKSGQNNQVSQRQAAGVHSSMQ